LQHKTFEKVRKKYVQRNEPLTSIRWILSESVENPYAKRRE
jgi:hypothetical protein